MPKRTTQHVEFEPVEDIPSQHEIENEPRENFPFTFMENEHLFEQPKMNEYDVFWSEFAVFRFWGGMNRGKVL